MKAIVVTETGGPEKLALAQVEDPSPGPGEVLVEIGAAGVNFIDIYQRNGLYPMEFPFTPGLEGAGTIVSIGDDVNGMGEGDAVAWANVTGSYAELATIPADQVIPLPEGIELSTAAAVPLQGITAHYLATDTYPLGPGHRCLIHAGAGGVGLLLTQIAKLRGAEVTTTVSTEEKAALSRNAGADHVILYTERSFKEALEDIYGPNQIDVVFDGVGKTTFEEGLDVLKPRGMMVTFGNASGPPPEISPLILSQKGSLYLTRPTMAHYIPTRDELLARTTELFDWIAAGGLDVRVGEEFALAEAADAHRALEGRRTTGKVLLRP
jgi:NADPH2:quinone reductase